MSDGNHPATWSDGERKSKLVQDVEKRNHVDVNLML